MIVHTVKKGETVFSIARKYAVSPIKIIENNCLPYPDRLIPGQMLLILTPTRTYIVRGGDTAAKLCRRFGIKKKTLLANNPALHGRPCLHAGTELVIRYSAPTYGISSINGYVYESTSADRYRTLLPYLTYVTFCSPRLHPDEWVGMAANEKKIPLLRLQWETIYKKYCSDINCFAKDIEEIKKRGFSGITLNAAPAEISCEEAGAFLLEIKKQLLGMDMLLFQETEAESYSAYADVADAIVLLYEKCHKKEIPDFSSGEQKVLRDFSDSMEPGKTFIELSSFGYDGEKALTLEQIFKIAIKYGAEFENDEKKMISLLDYTFYKNGEKKPLRISLESLENVKAKLELMHELGFMGTVVDVGRVPISYIMMLYNLFVSVEQPYTGICEA
jgi:LysM repeat protein